MQRSLGYTLLLLLATPLLPLSSCEKSSDSTSGKIEVPEGFVVEVAAGPDLVDFPMFAVPDETGRLFVFESIGNVYDKTEDAINNPQFRINLLRDLDGDGAYDKSTIFADKVGFPQGGVFIKGSLYASSAPDLLKFTDTDGDGVADKREVILSGWVLNVNANSLIGPFMAPDGWLYLTSAIEGFDITTKEGDQLKGETARVWRVRPDGSNLHWISAGGMNNPVGLTFTAASEVLGTQTYFTDPKAGQRDALMHWTEGGVYPKPNNNITRDGLPLTGDLMPVVTKYSRVAPSGITRYRSTELGQEYHNNLFSAQFNTHRVLRHKLIREGASFRTEDEIFFSTSNEDFHPTDVVEDGDGSLLVVETGGWFIKGCPLSQVSKPELQGSIYRVRKKNAKKVEDPFGNSMDWKTLDVAAVSKYLEDPRPFVADKAVNNLVDRAKESIGALTTVLETSGNANARTRALFGLYRISTDESLAAARKGLSDKDLEVRIATARVLGLAKDNGALERLIQMIQNDEPAAKRQAATALGQIAHEGSVSALLNAAKGVNDRFVEHAIIYALISINQPEEVRKGLNNNATDVKKAALIAIDQMKDGSLKPDQVIPFLTSNDSIMESTARWVVSHHPEWAPNMIAYLQRQLSKATLNDREQKQLKDILVSYCGESAMQQFMVTQMASATAEKKLFLLDAMSTCDIKEVPSSWIARFDEELNSNVQESVKLNILKFIRLHGVTSLKKTLQNVAAKSANGPVLRVNAIGTSIDDSTQLSKTHFDYLYGLLQPGNEASVRQQVAGVLGQARLSNDQLLVLANDFLGKADAFILPRIMPVFQGATDIKIGKSLAAALENSPSLDNISETNLEEMFAGYPSEINATKEQLLTKLKQARSERLARIHTVESNIKNGDIERGRMLFFGKAICNTCHAIGSEGSDFGPDLTSIQRDRSVHDLVEAIIYPSVTFVREYETYQVKTKDKTFTGIIQEQTGEIIRLGLSPLESVQIQIKDITSMEIQEVSMMPLGLDKLLNEQELADLMAFLIGQDQDPETDSELLR